MFLKHRIVNKNKSLRLRTGAGAGVATARRLHALPAEGIAATAAVRRAAAARQAAGVHAVARP